MTQWLVTVDPGKRGCGCALWRHGLLYRAEYVKSPALEGSLADAVEQTSRAVESWVRELTRGEVDGDGELVIELPQTYGGRADKGDANTLIELGCVVGAVVGALGAPTRIVRPHDWKGSIRKPERKIDYELDGYVVEHRARNHLSPQEAAAVKWPTNNWKRMLDVADGVGIGLWALRRAFG